MAGFAIAAADPWPLGRFAALTATPGIVHAVTTRDGPAFGTVGTSIDMAGAAGELADALGLAGAAWARQVHGGTVLDAREPGLVGEADALVTDVPGLLLIGRSADCPLVLAAGRRGDGSPAVGFAHASWRATVAGVTAELIARLVDRYGVQPATLRAAIAPSAGPCCYEVGDEVRDQALAALGPRADRFFPSHGGHRHFDLWAANTDQLEHAGVVSEHIIGSAVCTICQGERFWSWRVQRKQAGRFAAAIGILPAGG
jgi:YfiH family protein